MKIRLQHMGMRASRAASLVLVTGLAFAVNSARAVAACGTGTNDHRAYQYGTARRGSSQRADRGHAERQRRLEAGRHEPTVAARAGVGSPSCADPSGIPADSGGGEQARSRRGQASRPDPQRVLQARGDRQGWRTGQGRAGRPRRRIRAVGHGRGQRRLDLRDRARRQRRSVAQPRSVLVRRR